jgi:hypothetical protein
MAPIKKNCRFAYQLPIIRTFYSYVRKKVRIRGYFSKLKGVRQRKRLGNIAFKDSGNYMHHSL